MNGFASRFLPVTARPVGGLPVAEGFLHSRIASLTTTPVTAVFR
jgi:hypothetical protein